MTAHGEAVTQVDSTMGMEARPGSAMHCVTAVFSSVGEAVTEVESTMDEVVRPCSVMHGEAAESSSSAHDGLGLEITGSPPDKSFSI